MNKSQLNSFDKIIVSFSGGKDSTAALLNIIDNGADLDRIELHHNCIDGKNSNNRIKFDWNCTESYCSAIAKYFGLPICFSWREGGFQGQLYKKDEKPADVLYQYEGKEVIRLHSGRGEISTRLKFPAKSPDIKIRWCSGCLKIDVERAVITDLFKLKKPRKGESPTNILYISGERRGESANRAKYDEFPPHPGNVPKEGLKGMRLVTHHRSILDWSEKQVWEIIKKYKIVPHPAYLIGLGRCSCNKCIFLSPDDWATMYEVFKFWQDYSLYDLMDLENEFNHTIDNKLTLMEMIKKGTSYLKDENKKYIIWAMEEWQGKPVTTDNWFLPAGAFKKTGGPI